jgi:hypothetical protein
MRFVRSFLRFWWDFIIGDDWRIACGVTVVLALGAVLVAAEVVGDAVLAPLVALGIMIMVSISLRSRVRN